MHEGYRDTHAYRRRTAFSAALKALSTTEGGWIYETIFRYLICLSSLTSAKLIQFDTKSLDDMTEQVAAWMTAGMTFTVIVDYSTSRP